MHKSGFFDKLISRLDTMDSKSIQAYLLRLAKEKGFLETVFNAVKEGIIVIDRKLRIKYHNAAAKEMLGLPDELSKLRVSNFLRGVDWKAILNEDIDEWSRLVSRQEIEILYPVRRVLEFYLVPNGDAGENATLILNDVTVSRDKAASEAETERSLLVSTLAASVAHEIGNPLNSLYLHLQLLQRSIVRSPFDAKDAAESVAEAKKEIERLDSIINQFLKALRPSKPNLQPTDLKELVLESMNFMRHEIEDRAVEASCSWPESLPKINADAGQIKQAFYNLVRNAVQSMQHGGRLAISCSYDEESVRLSVADTGCGIKAEDITRIFKPYYSTKERGSGLGLMIVDRIVREHGARLSVDSVPGEGSNFTIVFPRSARRMRVLPVARASAAALPQPEDSNEKEGLRK